MKKRVHRNFVIGNIYLNINDTAGQCKDIAEHVIGGHQQGESVR